MDVAREDNLVFQNIAGTSPSLSLHLCNSSFLIRTRTIIIRQKAKSSLEC